MVKAVSPKIVPEQGDIIKMNLDPKQGHEQSGYRPYICLSNRVISDIANIAVFAPISSTKRAYPFYYDLKLIGGLQTTGHILLDQLVTCDYNAREFKLVETINKAAMRPILNRAKLVFEENE